jgi:hypothetical protein
MVSDVLNKSENCGGMRLLLCLYSQHKPLEVVSMITANAYDA